MVFDLISEAVVGIGRGPARGTAGRIPRTRPVRGIRDLLQRPVGWSMKMHSRPNRSVITFDSARTPHTSVA